MHRDRHPTFVEGCAPCRWASVTVASSAMPTRHPGAADTAAREKRWSRDMPAYKTLRGQGVQPRGIDGCADVAVRAESKLEVESGQVMNRGQERQASEILAEMAG